MRIYTVHELQGAPLDGAGLVLVKEGFSFPAFLFSWAWLLWQRLWIAFGFWLLLVAATSFIVERLLGAEAATVCSLALQLLLGFEANDIRRWTLERKGYRLTGIVGGSSLEEAERNFFARWDGPLEVVPAAPSEPGPVWPRRAPPAETSGSERIFGLFPKAGG
ncbi:conserved hypothetical protein [Parvibaculum lavamentivorans DS-1]|uniref:DUF2628 domain-containing protein n=1 Tax=Parvibaculum lavamentivorans (strain DS-1 / DSM 13023 / NCIMB 13966) TaxID=402881 RepID=A7HSH3_PARL1|nr:DUF2628 domain-containing protein [Parvibaculum lavamentivorans]ABS62856.1 conserved hypothetical protein [Parvibaculum lavamentivorans DS-1]